MWSVQNDRAVRSRLKRFGPFADRNRVERPSPPFSRGRVREAVEAERAQTRAWLHDSVLQVLEYLASGGYADEPDARELARIAGDAASELRAFVEGDGPLAGPGVAGQLRERLTAAVEQERALATHEIGLVWASWRRRSRVGPPSSSRSPRARRCATRASTRARRARSSPATSSTAS